MKNKIIKAIQKINPTAQVSVSGDDINQITWENGTTPISKEQILALIPQVELEIKQEEQAKIENKQSALNKLKTLGLTDAEIKALIS
jgi:predicted RNA binding protein with dsRBD fold (UPF0201 family)